MTITFLGHAGFCVETPSTIVITDPWLSPTGAFDAAWFQFPRNHHLGAFVQEKLADSRKERFLYISHEHKDHLDLAFLNSLVSRDFTLVIADFRRPFMRSAFADYRCKGLACCSDGETVETPDGLLKLYIDDSELNRDSALLVRAGEKTFLNLNDCRIFDALPTIARTEGPINVFACQFSGAGWHPTCYEYPQETYEKIARRKVMAKFQSVAQGVRALEPDIYLPSAGPPCFLDPALFRLNFEKMNIFPRAPRILEFLERKVKGRTTFVEMMPGDILDVGSGALAYETSERVDESSHEAYIHLYAAAYERLFIERRQRYARVGGSNGTVDRLRDALLEKLETLVLNDRVETPLYFRLEDSDRMLRVEFPSRRVDEAVQIEDSDYYAITAPPWEVDRVLDGKITWDDFSLTFRMTLNREPDVYQTLVQGFLRLEPEDLNWFCAKLLNIESNSERIVVEAGGKRYAIDRYCPHQGGDLTWAWLEHDRFLTCPRHQWQFDLEQEGEARKNVGSVHAVCLDDD